MTASTAPPISAAGSIDRSLRAETRPDRTTVRIGAVSYLNSKPLIEGLAAAAPEASLVLDYPSRLADELAAGRLDVALVPSIAVLHGDYRIVSDACVACRGPVLSVKLYSRLPAGEIRTLALDEGSRTSAVLARIMLAERFGVTPQTRPLPLGAAVAESTADAVLLIGDRAMHPPDEKFAATWDMGEEWTDWTGLPFVFAVWAARHDADIASLEPVLAVARDHGLARLEFIAEREAALLGIPTEVAVRYLTQNLHFRLGSAERHGLELFGQLAERFAG